MSSIPQPTHDDEPSKPAPAVALDLCQHLRRLIEAHHGAGAAGYSTQRDAEYRRLLRQFLDLIRQTPSLRTLDEDTHSFSPTLSTVCDDLDKNIWELFGRQHVIRLEGRILTILEQTGYDASSVECPGSGTVSASASVTPDPQTPERANRAQRRANDRRTRALKLRTQGSTIKEIARALGCSERTVSNYLQDQQ